jgi:hypothetical protein
MATTPLPAPTRGPTTHEGVSRTPSLSLSLSCLDKIRLPRPNLCGSDHENNRSVNFVLRRITRWILRLEEYLPLQCKHIMYLQISSWLDYIDKRHKNAAIFWLCLVRLHIVADTTDEEYMLNQFKK